MLRDNLRAALIEYDRKESRKRGYNPNALALYCEALQSAMSYIDAGKDVRAVLVGHFNGRLCALLLKVAGCAPYTREDGFGSGIRRENY